MCETILKIGSSFGSYRVVRLLGRGGVGEVYLVEEPVTRQVFAVKILNPVLVQADPSFVERFIREAELAMKVRHPNFVTVLEAGQDPETGLCYLVMEYLPGGTLRAVLDASPNGFCWTAVASVATDVTRALVCLEANGLVHRDVKPENVLLTRDGQAKLADLGAVRFSHPGARNDDLQKTRAEAVVGTPAYMAPEQMLDSHAVDIRSDLYSLGIMMHEMITGHRPNEGQSVMTALARALDGRRFPDVRVQRPETPPELAGLVAALTCPEVDQRPPTAQSVLMNLTRQATAGFGLALPWYRDPSVLGALVALVVSTGVLIVAIVRVWES